MLNACGYAAYKLGLCLWGTLRFTHRLLGRVGWYRVQMAAYTHSQPHQYLFLCTLLPQKNSNFSSVDERFVHIFHIAYKQDH